MAGGHDPGVVDQRVERAELILDVAQERLEVVRVRHVQAHCAADPELARGDLERLFVDVGDGDLRARFQQRGRDGVTDSARSPGDRHDLSVERRHQQPSSLSVS